MTHHVDVRNRAVRMYQAFNKSCRRVAALMDVGKSSVHRWVNSHPITCRRRPPARKVTQLVTETLEQCLQKDPFMNAIQLVQAVQAQCNVALSRHSIPCCLRRIRYSRKRTYARAPDTLHIQQKRSEFRAKIVDQLISPSDVISVDESAFYLHMKPSHGYSARGHKIGVPLHRFRCTRITLILAVSTDGVQNWTVLDGNANSLVFSEFVNNLLVLPHHRYLLMDNVAFHASQISLIAVANMGLLPLFNAPYTPEWNPVEFIFSKIKRAYRKTPLSPLDESLHRAGIERRIELSIDELTATDFENCFQHCWKHILEGSVETFVWA
jgi:transposase